MPEIKYYALICIIRPILQKSSLREFDITLNLFRSLLLGPNQSPKYFHTPLHKCWYSFVANKITILLNLLIGQKVMEHPLLDHNINNSLVFADLQISNKNENPSVNHLNIRTIMFFLP